MQPKIPLEHCPSNLKFVIFTTSPQTTWIQYSKLCRIRIKAIFAFWGFGNFWFVVYETKYFVKARTSLPGNNPYNNWFLWEIRRIMTILRNALPSSGITSTRSSFSCISPETSYYRDTLPLIIGLTWHHRNSNFPSKVFMLVGRKMVTPHSQENFLKF